MSCFDALYVLPYKQGLKLQEKKPSQASSLCVNDCFELPLSVYILDVEGKTLKINSLGASICGFQNPEQAVGLSLFDVSEKHSAKALIDNCQSVLQQERVCLFDEFNTRNDNTALQFLSIKHPCYDDSGQLIGLFGFSIVLGHTPIAELISTLSSLNLFPKQQSSSETLPLQLNLHQVSLSQREYQCLELCIKGFTAKQIARQLALSNRTVEGYLNTIKLKMNVSNKQELITKVLS